MNKNTRGGFSELSACAWLMSIGYDTFRNQNDNGPIDIVAVNRETGETVFCDAKTIDPSNVERYRRTGVSLSEVQRRLKVKVIAVTHEGACFWCTKEYPND